MGANVNNSPTARSRENRLKDRSSWVQPKRQNDRYIESRKGGEVIPEDLFLLRREEAMWPGLGRRPARPGRRLRLPGGRGLWRGRDLPAAQGFPALPRFRDRGRTYGGSRPCPPQLHGDHANCRGGRDPLPELVTMILKKPLTIFFPGPRYSNATSICSRRRVGSGRDARRKDRQWSRARAPGKYHVARGKQARIDFCGR